MKMKCLSNVERATYPIELVMDLTKLYQFKGKDFYYEDFLKNHLDGIIRTTVEADTLAFCRILKLNVTENRLKLLIRKDSKPKTKEEIVVKNLKEVFDLIQAQSESIELTTNEFLQLGMRIFRKHTRIDFDNEKSSFLASINNNGSVIVYNTDYGYKILHTDLENTKQYSLGDTYFYSNDTEICKDFDKILKDNPEKKIYLVNWKTTDKNKKYEKNYNLTKVYDAGHYNFNLVNNTA